MSGTPSELKTILLATLLAYDDTHEHADGEHRIPVSSASRPAP